MRTNLTCSKTIWSLSVLMLTLVASNAAAEYRGSRPLPDFGDKFRYGTFETEGNFVHNVGELQVNITNWGLIGSQPSRNARWSDAPSAMWPAGSGVDYLWSAGVWIGAIQNGVPTVSTGQFEVEILPNPDDPLETIWVTAQGQVNAARYPDTAFDDDGDGLENEDPLDGLDNDGDGAFDEDFAGIGNQHFRCTMRDNTALSQEFFPDHDPLDIEVVQETFQWENDSVDDFMGLQFQVRNIGIGDIQEIFLGFFADPDVGPRSGTAIAEDDLPFFVEEAVRAADGSLVPISIAIAYDADGDGGATSGFFGIMFLNHDTDVQGILAPPFVRIRSFQNFAGNQPFDRGGDPTNDAERYDVLSREEIDNVPPLGEEGKANDIRLLLANGPFPVLKPSETLTFQAAMVAGEGLDGLKRNAAEAALTFYGAYFDRDVNPDSGTKGRETQVCIEGAIVPTDPLFESFQDCVDSLDLMGANPPAPISPVDLDENGCIYVNADCPFEERRGTVDCTLDGTGVEASVLAGCTGVEGKEYFVPWLVGLAPDPPHMRLWQTDNRVHVFWNNISQLVPDVRLQKVDFESYRVWRADGWERPFGSSITNGPESRLWRLVAEFDVVDFFEDRRELGGGAGTAVQELPLGANTGLDVIAYTPAVFRDGSPESVEFAELEALVQQIVAENSSFFSPSIDPSKFLRYRGEDGAITPFGEQYPTLRDWECCYAQLDTLYAREVGIEFFEYIDKDVHNGIFYFYSVTATDFNSDPSGDELLPIGPGLVGDPQSNFEFAIPRPRAQTIAERDQLGHNIYVVPNPATRDALQDFSQLNPNGEDPTGVRVMFSNLPATQNTVRIFTLSGDLVETLEHDGTSGDGSLFWNLISRNGQEIVSGIYMYSVESSDTAFKRVIGRFVVVR